MRLGGGDGDVFEPTTLDPGIGELMAAELAAIVGSTGATVTTALADGLDGIGLGNVGDASVVSEFDTDSFSLGNSRATNAMATLTTPNRAIAPERRRSIDGRLRAPGSIVAGLSVPGFGPPSGIITAPGVATEAVRESAQGAEPGWFATDVGGATFPLEADNCEAVEAEPIERQSSTAASRMDSNLPAGSLTVHRANQASNAKGIGASCEGTGGFSVQMLSNKPPKLESSKGRRPVRHSYAITPNAQISVR